MKAAVLKISLILFMLVVPCLAQDPCAGQHARALALGGGGSKGAFEVGAAYHLIVHRGCDFTEVSGSSVGALNAAVLAQAATSSNTDISLGHMKAQAEALVSMWQTIKSSKDIYTNRRFAIVRFVVSGTEALKNFRPLRKLMMENVAPERLEDGRRLRVGVVSIHNGRYHEFVLNGNGAADPRTIDLLMASAAIPIFAAMPRIEAEPGSERFQFSDAGLRHKVPVRSYFVECGSAARPAPCRTGGNHGIPPHDAIEQLFIVTTTPYNPDIEETPAWETSVFRPGTHQITDGRKLIGHTLSIIMDSAYHGDLDWIRFANYLLRWRDLKYAVSPDNSWLDSFPLESYNFDPQRPDAGSRAYELGVVSPMVGDAGIEDILSFSRERIAKQMYCGCMASDEMMQKQFGLESMSGRCQQQFQPLGDTAVVPDCRSRMIEPIWRTAAGSQQYRRVANAGGQ